MSAHERSAYRSYLLRLWRHSPAGPWRASLQRVETGQTHHFAHLQDLWAFLQGQLANEYRQEADQPALTRPESSGSRPGTVSFGRLQPSTAWKSMNIVLLTVAALTLITLVIWSILLRSSNQYGVAPTQASSALALTTTPAAAATPGPFPADLQDTVPTAASAAEFGPEATLASVVDQLADPASSGLLTGDLNGDRRVNRRDLELIAARYNSNDSTADLNADGRVDLLDLSALARLVEPATGGDQDIVSPNAAALSKVETTATSPLSPTFTLAPPPTISGADPMIVPPADTSFPVPDVIPTEPSATATSPPTPTEIPPAATLPPPQPSDSDGWLFTSTRAYPGESGGDVRLYGLAINETGMAQSVKSITGLFYDAQDQVMAGAESLFGPGLTVVVPPSGRLPFGLTAPGAQGFARFEVKVEAEPSATAPRQDLEFSEVTHAPYEGDYCLAGTLHNQGGELTEYLLITVVLYDDQHNVISLDEFYEPDPDYIAAGETLDISICINPLDQTVAGHELQAWGL